MKSVLPIALLVLSSLISPPASSQPLANGVCDRSRIVKYAILSATSQSECKNVTRERLEKVDTLYIDFKFSGYRWCHDGYHFPALTASDFEGLINLKRVHFEGCDYPREYSKGKATIDDLDFGDATSSIEWLKLGDVYFKRLNLTLPNLKQLSISENTLNLEAPNLESLEFTRFWNTENFAARFPKLRVIKANSSPDADWSFLEGINADAVLINSPWNRRSDSKEGIIDFNGTTKLLRIYDGWRIGPKPQALEIDTYSNETATAEGNSTVRKATLHGKILKVSDLPSLTELTLSFTEICDGCKFGLTLQNLPLLASIRIKIPRGSDMTNVQSLSPEEIFKKVPNLKRFGFCESDAKFSGKFWSELIDIQNQGVYVDTKDCKI